MFILVLIMFVICPIISLPLVFIGLRTDKRHRLLYLSVIAVFVALFSYNYIPTVKDDLYRHHVDTMQYENISVEKLGEELLIQPEQLSIVYKYIIGKTGNKNLLQFFTSAISFFILFYLIDEYARANRKVRGWKLIGIWLFVLSGFHFIVITSGIFYTLSLEIFSLGIYFNYARKKKISSIILYIVPVFIHTCAILPLALIILYKMLGSKMNMKNGLILAGLIMSIDILLLAIVPNVNLPVMNEISNLYRSYFNNEEHWSNLHTVPILIMYLSRLVPVFLAYGLSSKKDSISDFSFFVSIAVIVLYFQTTFSIRYIHIAVLCSLPMLFSGVQHQKYGQVLGAFLYVFSVPHLIYQIHQLFWSTSFNSVEKIFVTNLITMLTSG